MRTTNKIVILAGNFKFPTSKPELGMHISRIEVDNAVKGTLPVERVIRDSIFANSEDQFMKDNCVLTCKGYSDIVDPCRLEKVRELFYEISLPAVQTGDLSGHSEISQTN